MLSFVFSLCVAFTFAQSRIPKTDDNGMSCDVDSAEIVSYHVHVAFNGHDRSEYEKAKTVFEAFKPAVNASMEMCPFEHPNCRAQLIVNGTLVSSGYDRICQLNTVPAFPVMNTDPIFSAANMAYYVPAALLHTAERWWRQHAGDVNFIFHACSGCEDPDHTHWTMFSYGYKFPMDKEALLCCHEGPPGCWCDMATFEDGKGNCLTANIHTFPNITDNPTVTMKPCPNMTGSHTGFMNGAWKVNYYRPDWAQLEVVGYGIFNTFTCLAPQTCEAGSELVTTDCHGPGLTRMHPESSTGAAVIHVDDCPGFCLDLANDGASLVKCPKSSEQMEALV